MKRGVRFVLIGAVLALAIAAVVRRDKNAPGGDAQTEITSSQQQPEAPPKPAVVSPAARQVLDEVEAAYAAHKSVQLTGSIRRHFESSEETEKTSIAFTSSFEAPNKFRHEVKDDLLLVSNGQKSYFYWPERNFYMTAGPIKERGDFRTMSPAIVMSLLRENPSLLYSMTTHADQIMTDGFETVDREADVEVEGKTYQSLRFQGAGATQQMLIDPQTRLIKRIDLDLKGQLQLQGVPNVKSASIVFDYATIAAAPAAETVAYDWTPPPNAIRTSPGANIASLELVHQTAPDFSLPDLAGNTVKLSELKGQVVVLDFWATYCVPCIISLPRLEQFANSQSGKGLKVFTINLAERKELIEKFLSDHKINLPVLVDQQAAVASMYRVGKIPHTVVVGKDGKIKGMFFGVSDEVEQEFQELVLQAMNETPATAG